ncbi:hypothetical protein GWI33_001141 [Rhynchophorus ferrugineus]|uniref:Uncharacterized protein n=1 Tax=Rhynchophorus ferrugineus TaxID=354439 RepID=A0A834MI60_RHYFE|nr:hypothetical protein GWI33_001141 [Rhynchophorus ferrugineus]
MLLLLSYTHTDRTINNRLIYQAERCRSENKRKKKRDGETPAMMPKVEWEEKNEKRAPLNIGNKKNPP